MPSEVACDSAIVWLKQYQDTLLWNPETCPAPIAWMPEFRREIRYYEEVKTTQ